MVDSESDSEVNELCWKWKFPRFSAGQSDLHQLLSPPGSASTESLDTSTSTLLDRTTNSRADAGPEQQLSSSITASKFRLRVRRRSVGDLSEVNRIVIPDFDSVRGEGSGGGTNNNNSITHNNNINGDTERSLVNNRTGSTPNSGGFLSFLGIHLNKSNTRHLDRHTSGTQTLNSSDNTEKALKNICENRYTRFPVSTVATSSGINNNSSAGPCPLHQTIPFDSTHIHLTPEQVSCTTCSSQQPAGEPELPEKQLSTCSRDNFLALVSSIGGSKSKVAKISKELKVKSKSDNSLHKVSLNRKPSPSTTKNSQTTFYPSNEQRGNTKLNSVQVGDHATVRLPWTGFQQNNLSSVTTAKSHPNTHNNIESNSERSTQRELFNQTHQRLPESFKNNCPHLRFGGTQSRSKSLERTSNSRISPLPHPGPGLNCCSQGHTFNSTSGTESTDRNNHFYPKQNNNLQEQEIHKNKSRSRPDFLLSENTESHLGESRSRNSQPQSHRSRRIAVVGSPTGSSVSKAQLLCRLQKSSTNSSFASLDFSSDSNSTAGSVSSPPSPPPRPASTLKPNKSRPIIQSSVGIFHKGPPLLPKAHTSFASKSPALNMSSSQHHRRLVSPPVGSASSSHSQGVSASQIGQYSSDFEEDNTGGSRRSPGGMVSLEDARNSGFINKPTKGWLHSDLLMNKEGVSYTVRYIGCLDVNTSMKSLDFDTRSLIAKECINQVCESAGLKSVDRKRKIDRRLARILGLRPRLEHAGSDVRLTITSSCLKLTSLETGAIIAVHEMPNISFASGGDATMLDFVAYVAKDSIVGRACFVLECGSGQAQDVITTIGQAFELRFKEYLLNRPHAPRVQNDDPEYYNDLPGKLPPEMTDPQEQQPRKPLVNEASTAGESSGSVGKVFRTRETPTLTLPSLSDKEMSVNLIDFEAPTPPAFGPSSQDQTLESLLCRNDSPPPTEIVAGPLPAHDPFDMQPFDEALPKAEVVVMSAADQKAQLEHEPWFHGIISRSDAEALLRNDGDFLVRESQTSPGQYVLTGLQNGSAKHLLLVDPEGVVRTKDRTFQSVTHLIRHHSDKSRPIISAESLVLLRHPIPRVISQ